MTRTIGERVFSREQAIDRRQVLEGATRTGAEYALRERDLGSLEVGKLADFIVIDKDYFTIPVSDVHTIRTILTAIGGRVAYRSADF